MLPYNVLQLKNRDGSTIGVRHRVAAFRTVLDQSLPSLSIISADHSCAFRPHWLGPALWQRLCVLPRPFLIPVSLSPALSTLPGSPATLLLPSPGRAPQSRANRNAFRGPAAYADAAGEKPSSPRSVNAWSQRHRARHTASSPTLLWQPCSHLLTGLGAFSYGLSIPQVSSVPLLLQTQDFCNHLDGSFQQEIPIHLAMNTVDQSLLSVPTIWTLFLYLTDRWIWVSEIPMTTRCYNEHTVRMASSWLWFILILHKSWCP